MKRRIVTKDFNGRRYVYKLPEYVVLPNGGVFDLIPIGLLAVILSLILSL